MNPGFVPRRVCAPPRENRVSREEILLMNREPDDLTNDAGTWNQPLTEQGANSASPSGESTASGTSSTSHDTPFLSGAKSLTPSETGEPPGDTTDEDARKPSEGKHERPRSEHGSTEWDTTPPPLIAQGEVLFGKYRLDEQIGEGGMGSVWKVWHVDMECERALKLIKPEIAQNDKGWRRFRREAQLMDKIKHPGAVRVYDYKRTQGLGYIEMEFVRGRSVEQILKSHGGKPMPLDWTAQVVEQLCAVLQEAHGHVDEKTGTPKPIIHRDLKPSNLMLIESKHQEQAIKLKVLDFGIAKMIEDESGTEQTVTGAGDLVGTPAYMSPEQITVGFEKVEDKIGIDGRSDLYSTGVMLYHLLTGVRPFRGSSMAMIGAHLNVLPPPMKESNPDAKVPPEVERVVMQCLEKDPANRPQSARELAEKFLRAAGHAPSSSAFGSTSSPSRARKKVAVGLGVVTAAVLVLGSVWRMLPARSEREPTDVTEPINTLAPAWIPEGFEAATEDRAKDPSGELMKLKRTEDDVVFVRSERPGVYVPDGYVAVFSDRDNPDEVSRLERTAGGAKFDRFRPGVYLPAGYQEVPGDRIGAWPSMLRRSKDNVKFIRIAGGTYQCGDPGPLPEKDSDDEACTPHFVRVPSFYIQENEVTDGEIEDYIKADPERKKELKDWKNLYSSLCGENSPSEIAYARRFPAGSIDYWTARKYAATVQGLLPTEAEWEYAARSRSQTNVYSYGPDPTPKGVPLKANLDNPAQNLGKPQPVDVFPEDATEQHVLGMTGSVQELCVDEYKPYGQLNLTKFSSSAPRVDRRDDVLPRLNDFKVVVKGGSFNLRQSKAKAFLRTTINASDRSDSIGFRVVIECPPENWPRRGL
jgi:eukaryotic-like serine/threonine-protein kinase